MRDVGCAVARQSHILVVLLTVLFVALERHIEVACYHSTVAEYIQTEGDILLPERELYKTPAQLGIVRCKVKTLYVYNVLSSIPPK